MDIWQAGDYADGSDGVPPAVYSFSAGSGQVLTFSSVTGLWTCSFITPEYGPDGTTGPCDNPGNAQDIGPVGPFSGYQSVDFTGALVGMFLGDDLPASAPPTLTFYFNDSSQGGIQTNFTTLSPQIGQVFFIGDGLTGTGTGAVQVFDIPPTATYLYLGFVDACNHVGSGVPGCYHDNEGSMSVTLMVVSPEPDTLPLTAPCGLWLRHRHLWIGVARPFPC
jgi:hypothetical protein